MRIPLHLIRDMLDNKGISEEHLEEASHNIRATLETYDTTGSYICPNCGVRSLGYVMSRGSLPEGYEGNVRDAINVKATCDKCGLFDEYATDIVFPVGPIPEDVKLSALQFINVHHNVATKGWPAKDPLDMPSQSFYPGDPELMQEAQENLTQRSHREVEQTRDIEAAPRIGAERKAGIRTSPIHRPTAPEVIQKRGVDPETGDPLPSRSEQKRKHRQGWNLRASHKKQENIITEIMQQETGFESATLEEQEADLTQIDKASLVAGLKIYGLPTHFKIGDSLLKYAKKWDISLKGLRGDPGSGLLWYPADKIERTSLSKIREDAIENMGIDTKDILDDFEYLFDLEGNAYSGDRGIYRAIGQGLKVYNNKVYAKWAEGPIREIELDRDVNPKNMDQAEDGEDEWSDKMNGEEDDNYDPWTDPDYPDED